MFMKNFIGKIKRVVLPLTMVLTIVFASSFTKALNKKFFADDDPFTLTCTPQYVFDYTGADNATARSNPANYSLHIGTFTPAIDCPDKAILCAVVVCEDWVDTNEDTGVKTLKIAATNNALYTAIEAAKSGLHEGVNATNHTTFVIYLKAAQ